MFQLNDHIDGR